MQIIRYTSSTGAVAAGIQENDQLVGLLNLPNNAFADLFHLSAGELRAFIEAARQTSIQPGTPAGLLAPIDRDTEVWASGVTYKRSEEARIEESDTPDIYARVYTAQRPELFFKANPRRVAGPDAPILIRSDSNWDVPEPELVLAINAHAEIIGYTIGNDVSSRSIEGENPLYLPQAKVYASCCGLGPGITPVWEIADPYNLTIRLSVERAGQIYWEGTTNTHELKRRLEDLVEHLFREDTFPDGVLLCTGTGLVPDHPFTLQARDRVSISIEGLGTLQNPVIQGKANLQ